MEVRFSFVLALAVAAVVVVVEGQEVVERTMEERVAARMEARGRPRTATFIPNVFPDEEEEEERETLSEVDNVIGKSPCPRGQRGFSCRQQLALSSSSCTSGQCARCRQECDTLSPTEWPGCCRDHLRCCRDLASACQQCNHQVLVPFCNAAFKRCN